MATPNKLLSTKGQEKMNTLKGVEKAKDAGGPSPFDTSVYANYSFDSLGGVKADTSASSKAAVKAEPMKKIDAEEDKIEQPNPKGKTPQAVGKNADKAKMSLKEGDELDDESMVEAKDEEEVPVDVPPVAAEVPAEEEDDDILSSLDELVDDDEQVVSLGDEEPVEDDVVADDEMPVEDVPADEAPVEEPVADEDAPVEDDVVEEGDEFPVIEVQGAEDDLPMEEPMVTEEGEECAPEGDDVVESKDEEEVFVEGKLKINFKLDDNDLLMESNSHITTEEKRQARSLFESAVLTVAKDITKTLHKAYAKKHRASLTEAEQKFSRQIDAYLSYVTEQWFEANKVPVTGRLQSKLAENFMRSLKETFEKHYIDVPESKVDVVDTLSRNVKTLKRKLQESEQANVKMNETLKESVRRERVALMKEHKSRLIAEAALALPAIDRTKFTDRAKTISFSNTKSFKSDLVALREQYSRAEKTTGAKAPTASNVPDAAPLFETRQPKPAKPHAEIADAMAAADRLTK